MGQGRQGEGQRVVGRGQVNKDMCNVHECQLPIAVSRLPSISITFYVLELMGVRCECEVNAR